MPNLHFSDEDGMLKVKGSCFSYNDHNKEKQYVLVVTGGETHTNVLGGKTVWPHHGNNFTGV